MHSKRALQKYIYPEKGFSASLGKLKNVSLYSAIPKLVGVIARVTKI